MYIAMSVVDCGAPVRDDRYISSDERELPKTAKEHETSAPSLTRASVKSHLIHVTLFDGLTLTKLGREPPHRSKR